MKPSKSAANRQTGKHQLDEQRSSILDAAEKLFLQNGLENTRMVDIAAQAGITKVTLYRYFPNRDEIAFEVHVRMMHKVSSRLEWVEQELSLESVKKLAQSMIRSFPALRDAYRYMGLFDSLYLDNPPDSPVVQWTKQHLIALPWVGIARLQTAHQVPQGDRFTMVLNTVVWFLEKLALRGELTWSDQSTPLEEHLRWFEDMILGYLDRSLGGVP